MPRPRRQSREALQATILAAARHILAQDGIAGLSARAIARDIGYTPASIYTVFDSMSDLLIEVNRDTIAQLAKMLAHHGTAEAPEAGLRAMLLGYIAFMRENRALWYAFFGGLREREEFPPWFTDSISSLMESIAAMLRAYAPALDDATALRHAEQIYAAIHGAIALDIDRRLDLVTRQSAEDLALAALDAMLARLGA
ncbi:TetR/AcrR family transcriptional regulator [Ketogulonicigenium vulgare]|uniref:Probable transcriptional regulator protein, TetR family protein n=1 Tax=Ketogulonicigenium vulgare (strain WSH-001) TaxID=759362 RepID=F9YB93_KETVW|nr:TetR/AcrR family transcriptional regulator [Ketogulonicigenium vulgare]ADO44121.1 transcriptional regulator, TetR family [Ketogulonicigenium vulgare Y25]AEM42645.1 probable transcriptional regulator protein, TetR family protein [Ketogulonicigenium vulgare WSH-001]ALJ82451.1 TetR family transcriptional regulator [Ketogulonicigenium vulgare]ANW35238.1 TetR family transcriptional regulator [Ketogulonicigenium vulgare]AOZ53347.1 transcriptional regulator, TetR family [Ketogulonicigenium vulgare